MYKKMFTYADDAIFVADPVRDEFLECNPAAAELIGVSRTTLVEDRSPSEIHPPAVLADLEQFFETVDDEGRAWTDQVPVLTETGNLKAVEMSATYIEFDGEEFVLNRVQEVSTEHDSAETLTAEREVVDRALNSIEEMFYVVGVDGELRRWNQRVTDVTGYDEATLAEMSAMDVFPDDDEEALTEAIGRTLSAGLATIETEIITADGERIPYEFSGTRLTTPEDGTIVGLVGIGRDITERKRRERELRAVLTNAPELGIFLFDSDLEYRLAGGAELQEVGLRPADFEGATPHELFPEDIADELADAYREALAGETNTFEQKYQGEQYRIQTLPVRDESGTITAGMAVSQNITERRQREQELKQQNERLEESASVLSHDLKNPLQVAQTRTEVAQAEMESDHLDGIATALERIQTLVEDVVTLARSGEDLGATEPVPLDALAERCWDTVPNEAATLQTQADMPIVADRSRLKQLLENLLRNAVEHGGDSVTITIGTFEDGFYVADDGDGIPAQLREKVLKSTYSSGDEGGYGLRIVDQIATAHGWHIDIIESQDGGARFEFSGVKRP